jgi:DNA-binding NarL/FixJ family response regulator
MMPETSMQPRILIVDDHDIVRRGIRSTITRLRPEWEICGEAVNGSEAVEAVKNLTPDVAILDITMPVMSGLEAASRIAKLALPTRILIFTMHESNRIVHDVRQAGAHGYVRKSEAARDLIIAIEALLAGGTFFGPPDEEPGTSKKESKPEPGFSFRALASQFA